MKTEKNTLNSQHPNAHSEKKSSSHEVDIAVNNFIRLYDARAKFFTNSFIKKVKEGNKKALAELQQHALPPTQMDLRQEFSGCLKANISEAHIFAMKDGKRYTMHELKRLVPEWASMAEKALMESNPTLADKLMSRIQWDAKSAFEVTFVSAMNELRDIKKTGLVNGTFEYYMKWIISPLQKAIEQVKAVDPPGNSLIGYGDKIPLSEALETAENLQREFRRALGG